MTTFQMVSLAALAAALVGVYGQSAIAALPSLPSRKPAGSLRQIESVVSIRDGASDPAVVAACNALLAVLLKVKS